MPIQTGLFFSSTLLLQVFLMLYRELYYRHIYASVQSGPTLHQRFESYFNYCALFNMMLQPEDEPIGLELPNLWLWDIIDEFIYQFQQFAHYRLHSFDYLSLLHNNGFQFFDDGSTFSNFTRENVLKISEKTIETHWKDSCIKARKSCEKASRILLKRWDVKYFVTRPNFTGCF